MVSLLLSPFAKADDNSINIEQSGDNLLLGIEQQGHSNEIKMLDSNSYITASSLSLYLVQINGNPNANPNTIIFDEVSGTGNQMKLCQGCAWNTLDSDTDLTWYYDSFEGGGHEIDITMYGDYNQLAVQQTNQSNSTDGHDFDLHLAGDSNEVKIKQQSDGEKTIDLTIYNDYNDVFIRQKGNGATHTASITLDGSYGTDLILKQLGTTTQSYSLTQNCITVSGCTISVQQGE
jgi:hypothetical protein